MDIRLRPRHVCFLILTSAISSPLKAALPDLSVVAGDIRLNQECKVELAVRNIGSSYLPKGRSLGIQVQFVQDDKGAGGWLFNAPISEDLAAGGEYRFTVHQKKVVGEMSVRVNVDHHRLIPEENENNNHAVRTVTCPTTAPSSVSVPAARKPAESAPLRKTPAAALERRIARQKLPDLTPEILSVPQDAKVGDRMRFYLKIWNQGEAWTPEPVKMEVRIYRVSRNDRAYPSSVVTEILEVPPIRSRGWQFKEFFLELKEQIPGWHQLDVEVDHDNLIQEKNEKNNEANNRFRVR